jgi:magnesium-transporting ATPase (P-type)
MKKIVQQISILLCLTFILTLPYFVFAANSSSTNPLNKLEEVGSGANGPYAAATETSVATIVGTVISAALSLLGVIFIILIVIAGYGWMTAGGNEEKVSKATARIKTAIIGLVVTLAAYAIWFFISNYLL